MKTPRRSPFLPLHSDAASGCLSGALRRLLCAAAPGRDGCRSELSSATDGPFHHQQRKSHHKPPGAPCIVARLMGLDSMPVFPYTPPPPESLPRSRSTNSAESWPGLLCAGENAAQARRASASFREAPTYLRQENEDFFVLSFTPEDASGVPRKERKSAQKENLSERKQSGDKAAAVGAPPCRVVHRKSSRIEKLEDKVKPPPAPPKQKQSPARKKIAEAGCSSSQDTSPVSVLDYSITFKSSSSSPPSEEERKVQRSRRKLSSKFENLSSNSPSPLSDKAYKDRATSLLDEPSVKKSGNGDQASRHWSQIWGKICMLTEQEVKGSSWRSDSEEASEVAAALALDMLDVVLHEAVCELSGFRRPTAHQVTVRAREVSFLLCRLPDGKPQGSMTRLWFKEAKGQEGFLHSKMLIKSWRSSSLMSRSKSKNHRGNRGRDFGFVSSLVVDGSRACFTSKTYGICRP